MKEKLIEILETFCPGNVFLQGSMNAGADFPQKFITFFTTSSDFAAFYSNEANRVEWSISVMFYSSDPQEVLDIPPQIVIALRDAGFIPEGAGNDIYSDIPSHTGWAMDFIFPEKY